MIKAYLVYEEDERVDAVVGWRLVRVRPYGHPDARGASFDVFDLGGDASRPESGIIKWDGFCEVTSKPGFSFDSQDDLVDQMNAMVAAFRLSFRWRDNDQAYGRWDEVQEIDFRTQWNVTNWQDHLYMAGMGNYQELRLHEPAKVGL